MATVAPETTEAAVIPAVGEGQVAGRTPRQLFWARFKKDRAAFIGLGLAILLILAAIAAPLFARITGHDPSELFQRDMTDEFGLPKGPNKDFWFGADSNGRDVFVRTIYGARTSILVAFGATALAVVVGVVLGIAAGYFGGKIDTVISRTMD
nr:ABC transporter permease [Actinomycetota bacterium]